MSAIDTLLAASWAQEDRHDLREVSQPTTTQVLRHLRESYGKGLVRVGPDYQATLTELKALEDSGDPILGAQGTERAAAAIERLREELANIGSPEARALRKRLKNIDSPSSQIAAVMRDFERDLYSNLQATGATFSLILFRKYEGEHGEKLYKSLKEHRDAWQNAISPQGLRTPDRHLAIIPDPTQPKLVEEIAIAAGFERYELPKVIFLGGARTGGITGYEDLLDTDGVLTYLRDWDIEPGKDIVSQLEGIYKEAYRLGALKPGTAEASALKKVHNKLVETFPPDKLLKMVLKAFGLLPPGGEGE